MKKPRRYLEFGVPAYWVVDPGEGVVRTWDEGTGPDDAAREEETLRWAFPEGSEPLEVEVRKLVAPF